jgi:hypothetical protein
VWFIDTSFGISMRVNQILIYEKNRDLGGECAFVNLPKTLNDYDLPEDEEANPVF